MLHVEIQCKNMDAIADCLGQAIEPLVVNVVERQVMDKNQLPEDKNDGTV